MYHIFVSLKLKSVNSGQFYWRNLSILFKKKPTCVQAGFLGFLSFSVLSKLTVITELLQGRFL